MGNLYWRIADYNAYIGIQCKEYFKRHKNPIIRKWWFLGKCYWKNQLADKRQGYSVTEDEIYEILKQYRIISFDVFDTLLMRPYDKPTDLFYELEKRCCMPGFANARIEAERQARQNNQMCEEINFGQIYSFLKYPYNRLQDQEIELEQDVLKPNENVKKIYNRALEMDKQIIIVSDMYLSKKNIMKLLEHNGYDRYEKVYVSSDIGVTKMSGNMYSYIMGKMDENPQNYLHIGDDFYSDGNACWKGKMRYLYVNCKKNDYILF